MSNIFKYNSICNIYFKRANYVPIHMLSYLFYYIVLENFRNIFVKIKPISFLQKKAICIITFCILVSKIQQLSYLIIFVLLVSKIQFNIGTEIIVLLFTYRTQSSFIN